MAKLEGVKTLDMENGVTTKIEYNGEVYEKVADRSPDQIGDIVTGNYPNKFSDIAFFEVIGINDTEAHKGTGMFYDEDGDYSGMKNYDTFRKVEEAPLFAKVSRPNNKPIVGDFIELDSEAADYGWLSEGKKYKVRNIDEDGVFIFNDDYGEEEWAETSDIKEIYVKYAQEQAEQKAKVGDKILIVDGDVVTHGYSNGDIIEVTVDYGGGDVKGAGTCIIMPREYVVLTDAQKGEAETKTSESELKHGDYAVILDSAFAGDLDHGDVIRLEKYEERSKATFDFLGIREKDGEMDVYNADELRPATQEEIAKALGIADVAPGDKVEIIADDHPSRDKGELLTVSEVDSVGVHFENDYGGFAYSFYNGKPRFKVVEKAPKKGEPYGQISEGDMVKLVIADGEEPEWKYGEVRNGDIGLVDSFGFSGTIFVDFPIQSGWIAEESELIKVADNGDLLPGTVVKSRLGDVYTIKERRHDKDGTHGTAYSVDEEPGWIGDKQFEVLTKKAAEERDEKASEEKIEVGDLVKVVNSPCGAPNGSYFIVDSINRAGHLIDPRNYTYSSINGRHVELIAKADEVYA